MRQSHTVRVIDSLAVYKDGEGKATALKLSQMSDEEAVEFGSKVGALIGLGAAGEEGAMTGAGLGAAATAGGIDIFSPEDAWDVQEDLALNTAAAVSKVKQLRGIAILLALAILIVGLVIGSAIAAGVSGIEESPLASVSDFSLLIFTGSALVGAIAVVYLALRLMRSGRKPRDSINRL